MKWKLLLTMFFISFLGTAFAQQLNLNALNKDQITQIFSGNTMKVGPTAYHGKTLETDTVAVYFASNGTMNGKWLKLLPGHVPQTDKGTWTVNNDGQLCVKWEAWKSNYCLYFYPIKDKLLMVSTDQEQILIIPRTNFSQGNTIP